MASFGFNPIACGVVLTLQCPDCGEVFETESLPVPTPDWTAENHRDSVMNGSEWVTCPKCRKEIIVELYNGIYGGEGEVNVDDDHFKGCEEEFDDEGYDYDKELFDASHAEIKQLIDAIDVLEDKDAKEKIYKMLYAKAITNLETYLGDTLKKYVLENDKYLRLFVEKYKPYSKESLSLCDIYNRMDRIKDKVSETLYSLLYHNLHKIKEIYKQVLGVEFVDFGVLNEAIDKRHDIVHRNGKDKDGIMHEITKEDVMKIAEQVNDFIYRVDIALPLLKDEEKTLIGIDELPFKD